MAVVRSLTADAGDVASSARPDHTRSQRPALSVARPASRRESGTGRHEGKRTVWRVQCGDLIDRERCLTVFVDDNEVVLVGPPGETARLTGGQLGQLRVALNEAAKLAER